MVILNKIKVIFLKLLFYKFYGVEVFMFQNTKKMWFKILPVVVLHIIIIFVLSLSGLISAKLTANVYDSFGKNNMTILLCSILWLAIYRVLLNVFLQLKDVLYSYISNTTSRMALYDIISSVNKEHLKLFEDSHWLRKYERVMTLYPVFGDLYISILNVVCQMITLLSYFLYLYQIIGIHALICSLIIVPAFIKSFSVSRIKWKKLRENNSNIQKEQKIFGMLTDANIQKESRVYQSGDYIYRKWKELFQYNFRHLFRLEKKFLGVEMLLLMITVSIACYTLFLLYQSAVNGVITVGILLSVVPFMNKIIVATDVTTQYGSSVYLSFLEYKEIKELFAKESCSKIDKREIINDTKKIRSKKEETKKIDIKVENLCFQYPNTNVDVLKNVSFEIKSGEKVAIVGVNGAGKSTLLKIIAGYYQPDAGNVWYNKEDIHQLETLEHREQVSFIFQNPIHYPGDFKDNILWDRDLDEKHRSLLRELDVKFLDMLENNKKLVSGFENSMDVSGGQWQKIALVRALNKNAEVFIFDEPTAALDPISEVEIFDLFLKETKEKTVILSTHRLGLARKADRILVLNNKQLVACGTHEELLEQCSIYKDMYQAQSVWYHEP